MVFHSDIICLLLPPFNYIVRTLYQSQGKSKDSRRAQRAAGWDGREAVRAEEDAGRRSPADLPAPGSGRPSAVRGQPRSLSPGRPAARPLGHFPLRHSSAPGAAACSPPPQLPPEHRGSAPAALRPRLFSPALRRPPAAARGGAVRLKSSSFGWRGLGAFCLRLVGPWRHSRRCSSGPARRSAGSPGRSGSDDRAVGAAPSGPVPGPGSAPAAWPLRTR